MQPHCNKSITPTTNQWPQNQIVVDDHEHFMASSSTNKSTANQDPKQHPLQCPRCSSSNTKFCYYNNYSLSQPRHFCKACKRYWTRGGTLRNVPVGGGCRKNKRHKRHPSPSTSANPSLRNSPPSNPLFYGLPTTPQELSFPFSSFRVSSDSTGFDLNPQVGSGLNNSHSSSIFFGSSSFSTTSTMASLLASTMQQQKEIRVSDTIPGLMPCEDAKIGKKMRAVGENRLAWDQNQNPMDQINSSDPSSLLWNTTSIGAWFDPSTMGSSVPSLI